MLPTDSTSAVFPMCKSFTLLAVAKLICVPLQTEGRSISVSLDPALPINFNLSSDTTIASLDQDFGEGSASTF